MKYQTISLFAAKGVICYETTATVMFLRVKITCFRVEVRLVFYWCLYNNTLYFNTIRLISKCALNRSACLLKLRQCLNNIAFTYVLVKSDSSLVYIIHLSFFECAV